MLYNRNNLTKDWFLGDQQKGYLIYRDPLNFNNLSNMNNLLTNNITNNRLNPFPGQPGPLGPLGKPTGRW